jgi:hypothetical protein
MIRRTTKRFLLGCLVRLICMLHRPRMLLAQGDVLFAGFGDKTWAQGVSREFTEGLIGHLGALADDSAQRLVVQWLANLVVPTPPDQTTLVPVTNDSCGSTTRLLWRRERLIHLTKSVRGILSVHGLTWA